MIDATARIDPSAELSAGVSVGAWSVIGADVRIGENTEIGSHVLIEGPTSIGRDNRVFPYCSVGLEPQDKKFSADSESRLQIGDRNTLREYCSVNRGTPHGGGVTRIGNDNWIMAYCHIAHDCQIADNVIFANNATLAGHVEIADYAILGGFTGVHQFCRIGESSFTAIAAIVVKDVPPYMIVDGNTARARAINREGLRRRGFSAVTIERLKRAYKILYLQGLTLEQALQKLDGEVETSPEISALVEFVRTSSRGIVRARRD